MNTAELTEKMQFRVTRPLKQAVRHVVAEELSNEQTVANYLLRLGVDAYESASSQDGVESPTAAGTDTSATAGTSSQPQKSEESKARKRA